MLAYGGFPDIANDYTNKSLMVPRGEFFIGNFNEVLTVDLFDTEQVL